MKSQHLTYIALIAQLRQLTPDTPEHTAVWNELEALKNSNGGQVPEFEDFADQSALLGK